MSVFLFCTWIHLYYFLYSTCKWYHIIFFSLFLTSLSMIFSSAIHIAANDIISFFLMAKYIPSCVCVCVCWVIFHCLCVCLLYPFSVDGHWGSFSVLVVINSAIVKTRVHVSFSVRVFSEHMPRNGIVGLYGNSVFSFLRNPHILLHSGCISLLSHQQCRRFLFLYVLSSICYLLTFWWYGHSD